MDFSPVTPHEMELLAQDLAEARAEVDGGVIYRFRKPVVFPGRTYAPGDLIDGADIAERWQLEAWLKSGVLEPVSVEPEADEPVKVIVTSSPA